MTRSLALLAPCAGPALADGGVGVRLPDMALLAALPDAQALLTANVVSSNGPGFAATDGEWALLAGAADILAHDMPQLGTDAYGARLPGPAFALLHDSATCAGRGPEVEGILRLLVGMGGGTTPRPPT